MGKNPWVAAALSFLIGGLGQAYAGAYKKAVLFFTLEASTGYVYYTTQSDLWLYLNLIVGAISIMDAYQSAKQRKDKKEEIQDIEKQPDVRVF